VHTLTNENDVMKEENAKLRKEIENLSEVKKVYMIVY
jgi:cell division protein FtsB